MHAQHRLLRHGPARKAHRGGLAQDARDLGLQLGHDPTPAVNVELRVGGAVATGLLLRELAVPAYRYGSAMAKLQHLFPVPYLS